MKTIRARILSSIVIINTLALLVTGGAASLMNYKSTVSTLQQTLQEAVIIAANQVSAELRAELNTVKEFAYNTVLWGDMDKDEKISQLHSLKSNNGFSLMELTDANGISLETGKDLSNLEVFRQAKSTGTASVSNPVMDDSSGDMLIMFAAPVVRNGTFQGSIIAGKSAVFLSDIVSSINVGTGNAAVLNRSALPPARPYGQAGHRRGAERLCCRGGQHHRRGQPPAPG